MPLGGSGLGETSSGRPPLCFKSRDEMVKHLEQLVEDYKKPSVSTVFSTTVSKVFPTRFSNMFCDYNEVRKQKRAALWNILGRIENSSLDESNIDCFLKEIEEEYPLLKHGENSWNAGEAVEAVRKFYKSGLYKKENKQLALSNDDKVFACDIFFEL